MKGKGGRNPYILLLLLLAGSIIGSAIWGLLIPYIPRVLSNSFAIGTTGNPWEMDLSFVKLTIGFVINMNLGSIIGMLIGLYFFYRL